MKSFIFTNGTLALADIEIVIVIKLLLLLPIVAGTSGTVALADIEIDFVIEIGVVIAFAIAICCGYERNARTRRY